MEVTEEWEATMTSNMYSDVNNLQLSVIFADLLSQEHVVSCIVKALLHVISTFKMLMDAVDVADSVPDLFLIFSQVRGQVDDSKTSS